MSRTNFPAWMEPCLTVCKGDVTPLRYGVLLNLSPDRLYAARMLANHNCQPSNFMSRKNVRRSIVNRWRAISYACLTGPYDPDPRYSFKFYPVSRSLHVRANGWQVARMNVDTLEWVVTKEGETPA